MNSNAAKLDLIGEHAIECGSSYKRVISVCDQPDLTDGYLGYCKFKKANLPNPVLTAVITILSKDSYSISIPWDSTDTEEFRSLIGGNGEFTYDVLFVKTSSSERFFSVRGKAAFIQTVTQL